MTKKRTCALFSIACLLIVLYHFIFNPWIIKIPLGCLFILMLCLIGGLLAGYVNRMKTDTVTPKDFTAYSSSMHNQFSIIQFKGVAGGPTYNLNSEGTFDPKTGDQPRNRNLETMLSLSGYKVSKMKHRESGLEINL